MKKMASFLISFIILLSALFSVSCSNDKLPQNNIKSDDIKIVFNGQSDYQIVYPKDPSDCILFSAKELSSFIQQITTVKLPIIDDSSIKHTNRAKYISIGETSLWKERQEILDIHEYNYDGFRTVTDNNLIFLCGARDRGTLYSVYDFLEKVGGVRFVARDETYVPKSNNFIASKLDEKNIPAFQLRSYYAGDIFEDPLFAARCRMVALGSSEFSDYGYGLDYDFYDSVHNSLLLLGTDHFQEHKELYAQNEAGLPITNMWGGPADICWTNGIKDDGTIDESMEISTVKLVLESLKKIVLANPNSRYFMIGQMDSINDCCKCHRCTAVKNRYGGNFSGNIVRFINVIARELKKWSDSELGGRELNLVTFAYTFSERPPVITDDNGKIIVPDNQVMCEDNVAVRIAPAIANLYYGTNAPQQVAYKGIFEGWTSVCKHIMIWDYTTNFGDYMFYIPNLRTLKENAQFYRDIGVIYVMNQADFTENESWQGKLKTYISSKLLWNPDVEMQPLIDEFLQLYYGKYASNVKDIITIFEDRISYMLNSKDFHPELLMGGIGHLMHFNSNTWPLRLLDQTIDILQHGINQVKLDESLSEKDKEKFAKRLTAVLLTPKRMVLYNYNSYYGMEGGREYAKQFLQDCKYVDFVMISEGYKVADKVHQQFGG